MKIKTHIFYVTNLKWVQDFQMKVKSRLYFEQLIYLQYLRVVPYIHVCIL
jgi:hypothetical protein